MKRNKRSVFDYFVMKTSNKKLNLQQFADDDPPSNQNQNNDDGKKGSSEKKYTDEDVDRIINQKFADWEKRQQKAVDEAKKLAEMNAQERAEHERDQLQKELDEYKKKDTLSSMTKTARDMLKQEDVSIDDELLDMLVSEDAETTKTRVNTFAKMFKTAVEAEVKKQVGGSVPKKNSVTNKAYTKEEIMKVANRAERQKLIKENMELFQGGN